MSLDGVGWRKLPYGLRFMIVVDARCGKRGRGMVVDGTGCWMVGVCCWMAVDGGWCLIVVDAGL